MKMAQPVEKKKATRKETSHQGNVVNMRRMPLRIDRGDEVGSGRSLDCLSAGMIRVCRPKRGVRLRISLVVGTVTCLFCYLDFAIQTLVRWKLLASPQQWRRHVRTALALG